MKTTFTNHLAVVAQLAIGTFVLAISLRTWAVMGFIEPVTVAGSSMAPTLLGPHVSVQCENCQYLFKVGAKFAAETPVAECPQCGFPENSLADLPVERGDRLLIDRTAFAFRRPRRWEPVVFVSAADEGGLVIKRVVGLPGETIQLRNGEVWIDGQLVKKSPVTQRNLRQLVHLETATAQRWWGDGWTWNDESWNCKPQADWQWLSYGHPGEKPITDDMAYNAGLTRRLFAVGDLCLSTRLKCAGNGDLTIRMNEAGRAWEIRLELATGKLELHSGGKLLTQKEITPAAKRALQESDVQLEISVCDQQWMVTIDGQVEFIHKKHKKGTGVVKNDSRPLFFIGARNLAGSLRNLRIYRAPYFASREESLGFKKPMVPITLGEREIYVLGDNVPVSLDSRDWGPLPLRFLVGRPLGVR